MVCTGYLVGWFTNFHGFQRLTFVERIFWSIPLSLAISTIASFLTGWAFSLTMVSLFFLSSAVLFLITVVWEWLQLRRSRAELIIGWQPLGRGALIWAVAGIVIAILSLVDFQYDRQLFMSLTIYDHGNRVSWTESIMRSGIPPANPLYWNGHAAGMRNYYFWYVVCAAVARMAHVSARAALMASCVWSGFALAALIGLYLKHFLDAGKRMRRQFLTATSLLMVGGLDIIIHFWNIVYLHVPPFSHPRAWVVGQIDSWFVTLLFAPHHIAGLVCCMFAFLLAWMAGNDGKRQFIISTLLIAFALASALGLSIYVTFAFFLMMLAWALWQVVFEHTWRSSLVLLAGGMGAVVLLAPYLWSLTHTSSGMHGSTPFGFAVRETVPPDSLLLTGFIKSINEAHPTAARNLANLLLLAPGIAVELGLYLAVFLFYLVPAFRARIPLTASQRSLVFISVTGLLLTSFMRSFVLSYNDFGFRGALLVQFALLLLSSEVITSWKSAEVKPGHNDIPSDLPAHASSWLRSIIGVTFILGILSTVYYAVMFRFTVPLVEAAHKRAVHDPIAGNLSRDAYISTIGYAELDASIPRDAIVQFNPSLPNEFWTLVNLVAINRQAAIAYDKPWCGAELGGDPSGCPAMAAGIDKLFQGATAEQARTSCRQYGIQFLVSTIYDPAWKDDRGWVWNLKPVVQDEEFRALDCRE